MLTVRTAHIKRIANRDDPDLWIEVQRVDSWSVDGGTGPSYQGAVWKLDWASFEAIEDALPIVYGSEQEAASFKFVWKKVTNPDDESQFVSLPVITQMRVRTGTGPSFQETVRRFDNSETNTKREIRIDRISHIDDINDPGSAFDTAQKLDVEVILKYSRVTGTGPSYQKTVRKLANDIASLPGHREQIG